MQNAQFGHITQENDSRQQQKVILGLHSNSTLSPEILRRVFYNVEKVSFEGIILENFGLTVESLQISKSLESINRNKKNGKDKIAKISATLKSANLDFTLNTESQSDIKILKDFSAFTDLFLLDINLISENQVLDKNIFFNLYSPVFLVNENFENFDNLVFVFDGEVSSIHALRNFMGQFEAHQAPLTALFVNRDTRMDKVFSQKFLARFLLKRFKDVGLQHTTVETLGSDLSRILTKQKNTTILTGKAGAINIFKPEIIKLLPEENLSVYFSS
ncbi:MAG: hypothetical protein OEX02_07565 [Cyclobacteriaceae bacterium]|nr:hypothetical protein [Cyclobacteriaceae bacterium]